MSEKSISISNLGKMYRLYRRPADKVLDAFGINKLLLWRKNYYQEFWALRDLNLSIKKGERIGLIGRNGAGKSTLLKIIAGNVMPTEGELEVNGKIQALLELGTGFHPEFSGRQNIHASLSYQGMSAAQIRAKEEDIVDFAELNEFIDQPLKTYSAGMYARLAFSTATAIEPDILIIDEILGAGDAYFAGKCVERMKRLTEDTGATVLFVSHDLGSVQQMCDRAIWIDRGKILLDGTPLDVTKSYYASILQQEEVRIKKRNTRLAQKQTGNPTQKEEDINEVLFRFVIKGDRHPHFVHPIKQIALTNNKDFKLIVQPGTPMDNDRSQPAHLLTDPLFMNWSEPKIVAGQRVRCFEDVGGKYLHSPFIFGIPIDNWESDSLTLEIDHSAQLGENVAVEIFDGTNYQLIGHLNPSPDNWTNQKFVVPPPKSDTSRDRLNKPEQEIQPGTYQPPNQDKWDSSDASFVSVTVVGKSGNEKHIFESGELLGFKIETKVLKKLPTAWLVALLYDSKGSRIGLWVDELEKPVEPGNYNWELMLEQPGLRQGEYICSFELLPKYDSLATEKMPFYCHWNRCVSFKIDENYIGHIPLGLIKLPFILKTGSKK